VGRVWGAPGRGTARQAGEHAAALAPSLLAFTRAARAERLEGYVIGAPAPPGSPELADWLSALLAELWRAGSGPAETEPNAPGRLTFNGLELAVSVLPVGPGPEELAGPRVEALVLLSPDG
jgi:hypothetical protein